MGGGGFLGRYVKEIVCGGGRLVGWVSFWGVLRGLEVVEGELRPVVSLCLHLRLQSLGLHVAVMRVGAIWSRCCFLKVFLNDL